MRNYVHSQNQKESAPSEDITVEGSIIIAPE